MTTILLVSTLFAFAGAFVLILHDDVDPLKLIEESAKSGAQSSRDRSGIHNRLEELGKHSMKDYENFRIRQFGLSAGLSSVVLVIYIISRKSLFSAFFFTLSIGALVYVFIDRELTSQIKRHRLAIEAEFPAVIEMMTLAIAAGETPMQAMLRIAQSAEGELAKEFAIVIAQIREGSPLHIALDAMGRRVQSVMIRRFVDAVITATLRGAPLIEVLSRHAIEARGNQRNRIMNAAGKAEVSMMIPVVFLILPISILFALWPSLSNLNLFVN